ncbi:MULTISPECIES: putative leader peptide [unclassified Streptomyces]
MPRSAGGRADATRCHGRSRAPRSLLLTRRLHIDLLRVSSACASAR